MSREVLLDPLDFVKAPEGPDLRKTPGRCCFRKASTLTFFIPRDTLAVAAKKIGGSVVVKAQIHAGGRGKGGGVKIAQNAMEAAEIAKKMLGMTLVTHQTGPEGRVVQRLLIEETLPIERELYLGIVLDRVQSKPVFMSSSAGGMEIEEVAAKTPELILKETLDPGVGLAPYQARK